MIQNADIEIFVGILKSTFGNKINTPNTNSDICAILAKIKAIDNCSIFQNNCNGICNIQAVMKLAENSIHIGNHRTI
jgi:hypothetical protein